MGWAQGEEGVKGDLHVFSMGYCVVILHIKRKDTRGRYTLSEE